jgi:hypothetical protein
VILLSRSTLWFDGGAWWLFLIAGGLILWLTRQAATTEPGADAKALAAADSRRLRRALRRVTIVLASILALIVVAVAIFMAVFDVHLGRGIGDRQYTVGSVQELDGEYRLGIGSLELDLRNVRFPAGETRVETSVDVGDLEVIVPAGVAVRAHGKAQVGYVNILGETDDGRNADVDVSQAGNRVLVLDADVGAGALRVRRAVR